MDEPLVRGFEIERTLAFIESYFDEESAQRAIRSISDETLRLKSEIATVQLYPRAYLVEALRAIAKINPDEEAAYADLVECGRFMSSEATNTYLRLLLKILSPQMFAKKITTFWERDNRNCGNFDPNETEVSSGYMRLKMVGAAGFDHCAPVSAGFCSFVLSAMGKSNVGARQQGWSLENPGPESYVLELTWS